MIENINEKTTLNSIFEPREKESSVNYVINSIKELLLAKKLLPGDRLPSEMDLSKMLSVSRGSIREAMKILSAFGVVQIKRGDGTYITKDFNEKVIFEPMLFSFILSEPAFEELQDLRLMLEEYIVGLVIKNQTPEVIKILSKTNMQFKKDRQAYYNNKLTSDMLLYSDLDFHYLLAKFAQNRLIERIYKLVLEFLKPYIKQSIDKPVKKFIDAMNPHEQILKAIEEKNVTKAKQAVDESIDFWRTLVIKEDLQSS